MEAEKDSVEEIWRNLKETKLALPKLPGSTHWNALSTKEESKKLPKCSDTKSFCSYPVVVDTPPERGSGTAYLRQTCGDVTRFSPIAEHVCETRVTAEATGASQQGTSAACDVAEVVESLSSAGSSQESKELEEARQKEALLRVVYELGDEVTNVRYGALLELRHMLFSETVKDKEVLCSSTDSAGRKIPPDVIREQQYVRGLEMSEMAWFLEELLITALLRRFGDEAEKCRHLSIAIMQE